MDSVAFDINDALKHYMSDPASIPTPEADGSLFDYENDPRVLPPPSSTRSSTPSSTPSLRTPRPSPAVPTSTRYSSF
ncbi:hypothetical protein Ct61P_00047 [Colletotrichum tofieldiae]|nr:hypothetical protein Ct61P_00047 [Colletotrichum tofieldiae]